MSIKEWIIGTGALLLVFLLMGFCEPIADWVCTL